MAGTWKGVIINKNNQETTLKLDNVLYVPNLTTNLLSLTKIMEQGWVLIGEKKGLRIRKNNIEVSFKERIKCGTGHVFGIRTMKNKEAANVTLTKPNTKWIHEAFCHSNMTQAKLAAKRLGMNVETVDEKYDCEECKIAKAKQKPVPKVDTNKSSTPGERLCIDTSSVKTSKSLQRFWVLVEDQATCMKWSFFVRNKDDQVSWIMELIEEIESNTKRKVRYIRCDNAGENKTLEREIKKKRKSIAFEYTSRNTPQQNGQVERSFATLYGKIRAMLRDARMTKGQKDRYWTEAASTATKIDNLLIRKGETHCPYKRFYNNYPNYARHLRVFGEKGIVTKKMGSEIKSKLEDRGILCTFMGYARNHTGDTYRMKNDSTGQIIITRDVKWTSTKSPIVSEEDIDIKDDEEINDQRDHDEEQPVQRVFDTPPRGREQETPREVRNLRSFNNPGRLEQEAHFCFNVSNEDPDVKLEPLNFRDAWDHPNSEERHKWRQSIRLEFKQMLRNGVWRKNNGVSSLPNGRKGIGTKWVFKIKKNGVYRSRLVAKGYDQIAGVDFQYNFAPVMSDTTIKVLLATWLKNNYSGRLLDVKTAFLYGHLEEEIFIKRPEGYQEFLEEETRLSDESPKYLRLNKSIYGLVQAAREWWKTFVKVLKEELGFEQFTNDSCLLKRRNKKGFCAMGIYVDDCLLIGDEEAIEETIREVKKHFDITTEEVNDFVGCTIAKDEKRILLHQPDLIKRLLKTFEMDIKNITKDYDTPASSHFRVTRPKEGEPKLKEDEQTKYRSGVGSLLFW